MSSRSCKKFQLSRRRFAVAAMLAGWSMFLVRAGAEICPRPASGGIVTSPSEIRSRNGVLRVSLALRSSVGLLGDVRYCYIDKAGNENPTLRVKPGDAVVLKLTNEISGDALMKDPPGAPTGCSSPDTSPMSMRTNSTNLHFHGLTIPPVCHQDEVVKTNIPPGGRAFEYRFRIPATQPPGLYWYHPHPHGHSEEQVLGGASGALIVDGIEQFARSAVGLPERLLVMRDQVRTSGEISPSNPKPPSKDLSVNFVAVPYPDYPAAVIKTKPGQRELWRVLNASADTFMNLHLLTNGNLQSIGLVSLDGVPLAYASGKADEAQWLQDVPIPPGGRAEFLVDTPLQGQALLLTSGVDTVPSKSEDDDPNFIAPTGNGKTFIDDDDYTPPRWILKIIPSADAVEPPSISSQTATLHGSSALSNLAVVRPVRERKFYFSESVLDPKNPRTSTIFLITEQGQQPSAFDPKAPPNVTVRQGDVEDWVVENRSQEIHSFHIHQIHFLVLERNGGRVDEKYLRDSVTVPYWDGVSNYPSVKLRMDFRDARIVGTFPYHCHILQHEDGGMMGTIRVMPAGRGRRQSKPPIRADTQASEGK